MTQENGARRTWYADRDLWQTDAHDNCHCSLELQAVSITYKTPQVAATLKTTVATLYAMLRAQKIAPPRKDYSGDFVWEEDDVARARAALGIDLRRRKAAHSA
jgi:hypothetical protein